VNIVHGGRGSGKTTRLIQKIKEFGGVLLVSSETIKKNLIAGEVLTKDQVLTFREAMSVSGNFVSSNKKYYIDCMELFIEKFVGPGCIGFSIDTPNFERAKL